MSSPQIIDLNGKDIYFFGDSITLGVNASITYSSIVTDAFNGTFVEGNGTVGFANSGATMMKQNPVNVIGFPNMEDWATPPYTPIYNPLTSGLLFVSFLTNDVGINLPNYSLANFNTAIDNVVAGLNNAGWPNNRIKFNVRYYLTAQGLDYTSLIATTPADITRYNQFADALKSKLDGYGIQYFDHWDILSQIPDVETHLDAEGRHIDNYLHTFVADNIIQNCTI
ncbi:hypothetical protein U9K52_08455 [Chryseobacterium sp. MHB01]|uniref:SGNH/GDSL hydrolase family protein n=1 Tax=Chryseobacterium sp. MHB01 TaxID=3109433 RepID=UPI002AFEA9ED|nr:SGNH/GDSL hydrolase family protein [Chryseobacterium sp. MHB01]MEA1848939.1 hypothetical protein [Chryseobacterium sp. MHB01]